MSACDISHDRNIKDAYMKNFDPTFISEGGRSRDLKEVISVKSRYVH